MERFPPFAAAGCTAFFSCALACAFGPAVSAAAAVLSGAAILFLLFSKAFLGRRIWFFILTAMAVSLIRYTICERSNLRDVSLYTEGTHEIACQITDILSQTGGVRYTVSILSPSGRRLRGYFWANSDMAAGQIGETFTGQVSIYPHPETRWQEASLYGSRIHLRGKLIYGDFQSGESLVAESTASRFRKKVSRGISDTLPNQQGALLCAVLAGDRSRLSATSEQNLRRAGLSHILALSGLHLSICAGLLSCLPILKSARGRKIKAVLGILWTGAYCFFTGAPDSLLRAGGMWFFIYLSEILDRPYHNINALGASVLVLVLANPFAAASVSMWYSAGSTLAVLWISPKLSERLLSSVQNRSYRKTLSVVSAPAFAGISAMAAVIPISWASGYTISLVSPVSSLAASVLLPFVLGFGLLGCFPVPVLSKVFLHISGLFSGLLNLSAAWIAKIPFSVVPQGMLWLLPCLAGTFVIGAVCLHDGGKSTLLSGLFWCVIMFSVSSASYAFCIRDLTRIIIPAGTSCAVISRNHTHFLVGEIGSVREGEQVAETLEDYHIRRLELAVLNNRLGGELEPLSRQAEIALLAAPPQPGSSEFTRYADEFISLKEMSFLFGEEISVSVEPFEGGYALSTQADGIKLLNFFENCDIIALDIYPKHHIVVLPSVQAEGIETLPSNYSIITQNTDSYNIYHAPRAAEMVHAEEKDTIFTIKNGAVLLQR